MFASILRRWRLVTPLVLLASALVVVAGTGLMGATAASASGKGPKFSGRAAGALVHLETPFAITTADLSACDTGLVKTRHSTQVGPITGGEPIVLFAVIAQSEHDVQVKLVEFAKCAAEVKTSKYAKTSTAMATDLGFENTGGIVVFDISIPPYAEELIVLPAAPVLNGEAELNTSATEHCVAGTPVASSTISENSATGTIFVASNNGHPGVQNDLGLSANQVLSGLAGTGYTAVLDEVTTGGSGRYGFITVIGLHIFGNGVDVALAYSHADIRC